MNDAYVDQSAFDLKLCLYAGVPDLDGQVLFKEYNAEISHRRYVRLGIVGASHFFSYRSRDTGFEFTELLACTEPPSFSGVMHVVPFRILLGFGSKIKINFPETRYKFSGAVCNATTDELAKVARFKEKLSRIGIALSHDFSAFEGGDAQRNEPFHAETILSLEIFLGGRLQLTTVHTYPNERKIVFTSSTLF